MSATLSICLMISHRLPTHWPKRPWRRCRRSSAVKCPHSPLTWPQALPAPAKRWVSSMTKHEQMLRVVCHLFFFFVFIMQQRSQHESCDHTIYNNVLPHDSCLSCWHEPLTFKCSSLLQITTLQLIFIQSSLRFDTRFVVRFTQICHQTAMSCTTEGHESAASTPSDLTEQCRSWPFVTWAKVLSH